MLNITSCFCDFKFMHFWRNFFIPIVVLILLLMLVAFPALHKVMQILQKCIFWCSLIFLGNQHFYKWLGVISHFLKNLFQVLCKRPHRNSSLSRRNFRSTRVIFGAKIPPNFILHRYGTVRAFCSLWGTEIISRRHRKIREIGRG